MVIDKMHIDFHLLMLLNLIGNCNRLDYQPQFGKWTHAYPPLGKESRTQGSGGNRAYNCRWDLPQLQV